MQKLPSLTYRNPISRSHIQPLLTRAMATHPRAGPEVVVAVLYQALEPPIINGIRKPMKPGGYQDSGADIAFALQKQEGIKVLTPSESPDPAEQTGWSFPDTESGILSALRAGATHLWANTILFSKHPLQVSAAVGGYADAVRVVGQPPSLVEVGDDKEFVNGLLRGKGTFTMPRSWTFEKGDVGWRERLAGLPYPVVGKPVRGRGSYGVKKCEDRGELERHVEGLLEESGSVMVEEYLSGEEATVTVMPPSSSSSGDYWALPIVTRFNHISGIAPYNGAVAVTANSRAVTKAEYERDPSYGVVARECEAVAGVLRPTAPIRIDVRRFGDEEGERFALFDVNMKPNMTGPGRPGRDGEASLSLLAAGELGWDYGRLLVEMLGSASSLRVLREVNMAGKQGWGMGLRGEKG